MTATAEGGPAPEPEQPMVLPAAPTGLTAVSGASGIDVSWDAPSDDIVGYGIYRCEEGETPCTPEWIAWVANTGDAPPAPTGYSDSDVTEGTTYRYAVTSNNIDSDGEYRESEWSDEVTVLAQGGTGPDTGTPLTPSQAPTGLTVTATSAESVSLSWTAPPDDGGGPIEAYNVYRCDEPCELTVDNWIAWVDDGTVFTDTHDDSTAHEAGGESPVEAGTTYRYAVAAYRGGDSDWSNEVTSLAQVGTEPEPEPEQPMVLPAAPTGLTAVSGASGIDVSWDAPSDDIVGYSIYRCEEGETPCTPEWIAWVANTGDAPPAPTGYSDSDVTEGTTYRYAVTSNNIDSDGEYRESEWSDEVTVLAQGGTGPDTGTPLTPSQAPTGLTVTATSAESVSLSWTAPPDDGGGPIEAYNVYRCDEPCELTVDNWIAWVDDGTVFTDTHDDSTAHEAGGESPVEAGTTYRYAVAAYRGGDSDWSNEVTSLAQVGTEPEPEPEQPMVLPAAPTGLTAVSGASGIDVSWDAPSDDIVGYGIYRCEEGETPCTPEWIAWVANTGDAPPAPTGYSDSDVTEGTTYRYAVTSNNIDSDGEYRESEWSDEVTVLAQGGTGPDTGTPLTPSQAPTGLTVTATSAESVSLSWTAPPDDGGGPIEAYNVYRCDEPCELTVDNWIAWVDDGTVFTDTHDDSTAHEAGGESPVEAGTTYRYAVAAYRGGDSDWSNEVTSLAQVGTEPEPEPEQPMVLPAAPTGLTAVSGASGIDVSWDAPSDDIVGYSIYRCEEGETPCTPEWIAWVANTGDAPPAPTGYSDSDVTEGTTYRYAVTSNNIDSDGEYRESEWSDEVTVLAQGGTGPDTGTPLTPSQAPTGLTVTATSAESVSLSWTAPPDDGGGPIEAYNVYRCDEPCELTVDNWIAWVDDGTVFTDTHDDSTAHEAGGESPVEAGTTYRYAVAAYRGGDSDWSNEVTSLAQVGTEPEPEPEQPMVLPAAPTGLTAVSGASGIDVSWDAPSDDIVGYGIYRCEEGETPCTPEWIAWVANTGDAPPAPTGYSDSDVTEGTTYRYAVTSNNIDSDGEYRESEWSDEVTVLAQGGTGPDTGTPLTPSQAPTGLTVTATSAESVSLSWTAPPDDGGGPIEAYNVYRCDEPCELTVDNWIAWVDDGTVFTDTHDDSTAHEAGGESPVEAGTTYRYAVAAYRGGDSDWSNEVTSLAQVGTEPEPEPEQPMVLPAAPTGLTAVSGASGIDVSWDAPSDDIVGYSIYRCEEGETPCTPEWIAWVANTGDAPPAPTGYSDSDVTEGTTYRYAVTSNNIDSDGEYRESEWSDEVTVLAQGGTGPDTGTPLTPSQAPTGLTVTATSAESVSLSWTAPPDDGGGPIEAYNVYRCDEPCELTVDNWIAWVDDGTVFTDTHDDSTAHEAGGESPVEAGTTYRYAVAAYRGGDSDWSNEVTSLAQVGTEPEPEPEQPMVLPAAPTGLTAVSGASGIDVSWDAPSDDIVGYSIYRCEEGETPCTPEWIAWVANTGDAPPAPTGYSDSDVTEGTTYRYAVTSNNIDSDGEYRESEWSDEVTVLAQGGTGPDTGTPLTPSQAPTGLTVTATSAESVSLSWTAPPDDGGGPIEAYNVYRCDEPCELTVDNWIAWVDDGTVFTDTHDDSTAHEAGGESPVEAGTTYRYAVAAYRGGDSDWSNEVTSLAQVGTEPEPEPEQPMVLPAAPTGLTAVSGASGIDVSWDAPSDDIVGYSIYRCEEGETPCTPEWIAWVANTGDAPPAPTGYSDSDVTEGTTYRYAVTSNNIDSDGEYRESEWSDEVTALAQGGTGPEPEPEVPEVTPADKQAALEDVSATIGRNMLSSVVSTIGNRFTATSDTSEFSLAGRQVTLDEVADQMTNEIGWDSIDPGDGYAGLVSGSNLSTSEFGFDRVSPRNDNRTVSWRQLLGGSSFLMSFGAGGENSRQWNLWGNGDIQSFDGDSHDGDIYTGYLGADLRIRQDLLAGVSVSHSAGEADYVIDDQEGKLHTKLTTVLPYTRLLLNDRTEVWAILGVGWGEAEHSDGSVRESADLSVALGAFGGRRKFGMDSGGMNWAVRADTSFIRLWTDEGMQTADDLAVNASQLRLGLEASHPFILKNSAMVRPFADVGVRYDGGDGENTGAGIEIASGLRYDNAASGFWLEARGRMLVLHSEDDDYEEQGFSLSAGLQPYSDGTGLSLLVSPRLGSSVEGTEAMLRPNVSGLYNRENDAQRRGGSLHTELSYGFATPKTGGVTTPFAEFDVTDGTGYRAKLGTRYHLLSGSSKLKLELSSDLTTMPVHGISTFNSDTSPSHEVWLTAELQGLPTTTTDNRHRRAVRMMAQADNAESTAIDDKKVVEKAEGVVEIEEIRVIGSRFQRSLSDALDEKRRASEIIEALSAEDIGELPGTSVAESLAKLPGVSYTRNAFGANNVSIRGLGAVLTNGTLNDRDLASEWGDRSVSFNMFPAELISRASLYKAPSASHVEGGIGGSLNLQTARALEWGERYVAVNVRGRYNDLAGDLPDGEEFGYRGSIAYLDQFADDTLGIAVGYAGQYAPLVGADSQIYESRTVGYGGAIDGIPNGFGDHNSFNIPYGSEYSIYNGTSDRHSVLGAIQWKPVENFEVNFDGFFSTFDQTNTAAGLRLAGGLGSFGNRWRNVETDGFNVAGATVTCLHEQPNNCVDRSWGQDLAAFNALEDGNSELHSYGIEGKWSAGALTLVYDFSYSKAVGEDSYTTVGYRPYNGLPGSLELVRPVSMFGENEDGAGYLTSPLDFTDLATNRVDAFRLIENEREDEIFTYKFDSEYAIDYPFFTAFKAGVRLVNRDNLLIRRDARLDPLPSDIESSVALSPDFVFDVYDQSEADSAFDANPVLVLNTWAIRNTVFAGIEAEEQASGGHFIEEDIKAYYVQADFETDALFGVPASGNFGVRVVTTDVDTQGTTNVDGVEMLISTSDKYTEVLPSVNINFFPTDDIVVRIAGSRVLARPAITFLSPGTDKYEDEIYSGANGGGNPFLRPYIANQFDLSFERYFDRDTAIALAFFYKDMDTFITQARTESGPPDDRVTSFIAANGAGGRILGIEATVQHTFANLLPEGYGDLGVYATYTWTDSNIELSETFNSSTFGLDGQSKHLGNVTLHYHRDKFGARASYRYRSEFTRPQRSARAFTVNRGEGDLSFQMSYDFNKQLRLFVEGWGLLNEPRDNFHGLDSLQGQYTLFGRNIQLGASYRF